MLLSFANLPALLRAVCTDPPPQLAADGYRILNAAWTPLYIAGGTGQSPELIYQWNPWLLGEFPGHVSWWSIPRNHREQVIGVKMAVWSTDANDTLCSLSGRLPASGYHLANMA